MQIINFLFIIIAAITVSVCAVSADGLDTGKSITIGKGAKVVFEFTDPDCPYCRKASKYFEGRSDVTRHVFFYPLPSHPKAREKAQFVLSQPDKAAAYRDAMSGKMDAVQKFEGITAKGIKLQGEQLEAAKGLKVDSTPTFMINGRIIEGFDLKKIEEALGN